MMHTILQTPYVCALTTTHAGRALRPRGTKRATGQRNTYTPQKQKEMNDRRKAQHSITLTLHIRTKDKKRKQSNLKQYKTNRPEKQYTRFKAHTVQAGLITHCIFIYLSICYFLYQNVNITR